MEGRAALGKGEAGPAPGRKVLQGWRRWSGCVFPQERRGGAEPALPWAGPLRSGVARAPIQTLLLTQSILEKEPPSTSRLAVGWLSLESRSPGVSVSCSCHNK